MTKTDLPAHLRAEVASWVAWHTERGLDPQRSTAAQAEAWVGSMAGQTHAVRLSAINAVAEWHQRYLGRPSPWAENPYPYPLLTRYLPMTFDEAWAWVSEQPQPQRSWLTLVLCCRAKATDVAEWDGVVRGSCVTLGGRTVPLGGAALTALAGWVRPRRHQMVSAAMPLGVKVTDFHAALALALEQLGIPEVTRASVYGRWSAMRFAAAAQPLGLFRTPTGGGSRNSNLPKS